MDKLRLSDLDPRGKAVFVRVDFNVPFEGEGQVEPIISDDSRIRASLPTLEWLLDRGAKLVVASHLGRPKGKVDSRYSLKPVRVRLAELLGREVALAPDCVGAETEALAAALPMGGILLLENLRYHAGEESNDDAFARALAALAPLYVNDAFGASHRAHASVDRITRHVEHAAAGLLLEREVTSLTQVRDRPLRPFLLLVGGAKVADKIPVIEGLLPRLDQVAIGGAMALTFLRAQGHGVGRSRVEDDKLALARSVMAAAAARGVALSLPSDHVAASELRDGATAQVVTTAAFPDDLMGLDIGPETAAAFASLASKARTIVWNGPMGVFEMTSFAGGTETVARAVAASPAFSVVGGGDSVAALQKLGIRLQHGLVSTGGGASLELLSGEELPGVAALHGRSPG